MVTLIVSLWASGFPDLPMIAHSIMYVDTAN
jgi:hypothetical protein